MREHLYKGFHPDGNGKTEITLNGEKIKGEWTEGYFYKIWDEVYILWGMTNDVPNMEKVIPETVCEYTGLTDKNGKKIFEGHIVKLTPPKDCKEIYVPTPHNPQEDRILKVVFFDGVFAVDMRKWFKYGHGRLPLRDYETERLEVIGNIYDNSELLEVIK